VTDRPAGPGTGQPGPASPGRVEIRPGEYAVKNGQYLSSVWMQRLCRPDGAPGLGSTP
jgi:hypothetical protein